VAVRHDPRPAADPSITVTRRGCPTRSGERPSLLTRLHTEWEHVATTPAATRALHRWTGTESALTGIPDLPTLRDTVHDRTRPDRADRILAALVRLAAHDNGNDPFAARVVLQLLLPGATSLCRALLPVLGDSATAQATVISELAIGIATYPWQRRPHRVAANLLLDTRQRITRRQQRHQRETSTGLDLLHDSPDPAATETTEATVNLAHLLDWARRHRVLDDFEARLLVASRVHEIPMQRIADAVGRSRSSLFAARTAAERRLRHALTADRTH
jgi:hypothetical protein